MYVSAAGSDSNPGTQAAPFLTIQKAINEVATGGTVNVAAGTYVEIGQMVISKNLTIVGADKASTIIKPAQDTSGDGDTGSWILVNDSVTFNLSKVTLDGVGREIRQGIRFNGSGTVDDVIIQNIGQTGYMGFGIAQGYTNTGPRTLSVTNSTFTNFGRVGVQADNGSGTSTVTISGNTFTGKGAGDHLDYGITVEGGANATITGNTITNCRGVASSDGSTSAAISVTTYFAGGSTATITDNTLTNNSTGIGVGYDASDTSTVVAHHNKLTGNGEGISSTAPVVNGTENWWGETSGPGPVGPGTGDKVSAKVTYSPWCTNVACSTFASETILPLGTLAPAIQAAINAAAPGSVIVLPGETISVPGGFFITVPGVTIVLSPGTVIIPSSPCFTVSANDITLIGGVCQPPMDSNGVETGANISNLVIKNMEIRNGTGTGTGDGIHLGHNITNLQILDNYIHNKGGDGVEYATGTTVSGVHEVQGNLFQNNGGYGINNASGNPYVVEYNSWGLYGGPTIGVSVSTNLDFTPWTHVSLSMVSSGSPVANKVGVGQQITYTVKMDAAQVFGADFDLNFSTANLSVVSITNSGAFGQNLSCGLSTPSQANASGVISFCGDRITAGTPLSGSAQTVFTVVFQGIAPGGVSLNLDETDDVFAMVNPGASNNIYAAALTDGSVTVYAATTVTGRLDLQGRANDTGAVLSFGPGSGQGNAYTFGASSYWGAISQTGVITDTYAITVSMPRYLDVTVLSGKSVIISGDKVLSTLILLGGDANDDNDIGISDATIIGGQYGNTGGGITDARADINNDGTVDIYDLVLMGGNFGFNSGTAYSTWTP